jgi:membrane associated rhomboid family serine protease
VSISITFIIILATISVSIQAFNKEELMYRLSLSPYEIKHQNKHYKFITYLFVHADWAHLLFNMISFWMFGEMLETELAATYGRSVGPIHFVILYFVGGLFSTFWPMIRNQDNPNYISLGASGAVSSIIFAAMMWQPTMQLSLIFLPGISIPAYIFAPLYLAFEFYAFKRGKTNIAHDAHIGGSVFGIAYVLFINFEKGKEIVQQIFG